jgi:SAM-dependent methyltransferase
MIGPDSSHDEAVLMSKSTGLCDDDSYGGRQPTSHERRAGQPWDASYSEGPPPWDIGAPQPAVVRLAKAGAFAGTVLDAGCGTGENALHIAAAGLDVLGVDVAGSAVSIARASARARGIHAEFIVADALRLDRLGRVFDRVLDCALFHAFDSEERRDYVASLASVMEPGGRLYVLCFSDTDPEAAGPHPVSRQELSAPFTSSRGWRVASIDPERLQATFAPEGAPAWLAKIERIEAHD